MYLTMGGGLKGNIIHQWFLVVANFQRNPNMTYRYASPFQMGMSEDHQLPSSFFASTHPVLLWVETTCDEIPISVGVTGFERSMAGPASTQ